MLISVYGKTGCPTCDQAKKYLDKEGFNFEYKSLGSDYSIAEFYEVAPKSHRTFPMIAIDGEYIGSFNDLLAYLKS